MIQETFQIIDWIGEEVFTKRIEKDLVSQVRAQTCVFLQSKFLSVLKTIRIIHELKLEGVELCGEFEFEARRQR